VPLPTRCAGSAGPHSLDDAIEWLRKRFRADAAESLRASYRVELGGEAGGVLRIAIDDGRLELGRGAGERCDVVLRLAAGDFFDVLAGRANPDLLHMDGRLEIDGDLSLALKLRKLFAARA
jgi:predicted lipid carrier protein YhbT